MRGSSLSGLTQLSGSAAPYVSRRALEQWSGGCRTSLHRGFRRGHIQGSPALFSASGCAGKRQVRSLTLPASIPASWHSDSPDFPFLTDPSVLSATQRSPGPCPFSSIPQQARHWVTAETDRQPQHALEGWECECGEEGHPHHDSALQGGTAGKGPLPSWGHPNRAGLILTRESPKTGVDHILLWTDVLLTFEKRQQGYLMVSNS